jgi:hypothetical protein
MFQGDASQHPNSATGATPVAPEDALQKPMPSHPQLTRLSPSSLRQSSDQETASPTTSEPSARHAGSPSTPGIVSSTGGQKYAAKSSESCTTPEMEVKPPPNPPTSAAQHQPSSLPSSERPQTKTSDPVSPKAPRPSPAIPESPRSSSRLQAKKSVKPPCGESMETKLTLREPTDVIAARYVIDCVWLETCMYTYSHS